MNMRLDYQQKKNDIIQCFNDAITLGDELKAKYGEFIPLDTMIESLTVQRNNWNDERFEIVVVGEFSTGKSTFINALLRKNILPSKVTATTATVNFIRHIDELHRETKEPIANVVFNNGKEIEVPYEQLADYVTEMSEKVDVSEEIHHVDLYIESPYLENGVVLVDTPGLEALNPEHEKITKNQIKKSNASILLLSMEQPVKLSEIKFLRDLSESIDRIFFVANRLDAIPSDEVDEVIVHMENALKNNDYQKVDETKAHVYPVSALKALMSRDSSVTAENFKGKTPQQLITESRFEGFEERLENYLFNGDKFEDYIAVPYAAINYFYDNLLDQLEAYKSSVESNDDTEEIEKKYELLKSQIEVRNEQLKSEISKLKSEIRKLNKANRESFVENFDSILTNTQRELENVEDFEYIEEEFNEILDSFNSGYVSLVDTKLKELSRDILELIEDKIDDFEMNLEKEESFNKFSADLSVKKRRQKSYKEINNEIEMQLASKKEELAEQRKILGEQSKLNAEREVLVAKQASKARFHDDEVKFAQTLLNSTDKTIEKYGVIGKRFHLFSKKGMINVPNEEYEERIKEMREAKKRQLENEQKYHEEISAITLREAEFVSLYESKDELREAENELREEKRRLVYDAIDKDSKYIEKQLRDSKRKVISALKDYYRKAKSDYGDMLRNMDGLKAAEQKIDEYIKSNDDTLKEAKRNEAFLAEQLMQSAEHKEELKKEIESVQQRVQNSRVALEMTKL